VQEQAKHRRLKVVRYTYQEPFNFAKKMNFLAKHASGEHLLILNDDIEVISPEWMTAMLEYSQLPEVGVVGAKLYYPDGRLQHVGVVMGIGGGASHVFTGKPKDFPGYFASTKVIRNYSVVTGACAMTKRRLFEELGGFDEKFRIDYNDVDYCLRLRAKGLRVVYTPYAELFHHESTSLGSRAGKVGEAEERLLRRRWAEVIANDPYYNPNLTLQDTNYQIRS
jgi:GT2 family glycosyltransferase